MASRDDFVVSGVADPGEKRTETRADFPGLIRLRLAYGGQAEPDYLLHPMVSGVFGSYTDLLRDTTESFQDKFCRHFGVPADRFERTMLRRTFYWHARWLRWLFPHDYLSPDRCFVASVGRLTRRRDFPGEVVEFHEDDRNLTFLRRTARLRVSSARMRALFREVWPDPTRSPATEQPAVRAVHAGVSQLQMRLP